jgi:hypothetical protein
MHKIVREMATKCWLHSKAPISKHQIPNNTQIPILNDTRLFRISVIWDWKLFGIWDLDFGFSSSVCLG